MKKFPKVRGSEVAKFGWGYEDTKIEEKNGQYGLYGPRKPEKVFPYYAQDILKNFNLDFRKIKKLEKHIQSEDDYPPKNTNQNFVDDLKKANIDYTEVFMERFLRSLSQTATNLYHSNYGKIDRVTDLVIFPESHDEVVKIVELANTHNVVLIPVGGNTNVSDSSLCPQYQQENRSIATVDLTQMNRMLWIDEENQLACFESGVIGVDLENMLREHGHTTGHEPDSIEHSTLGGWVSTRASGMKRAKYGNIEEIVKNVKFVTSTGVLSKPVYPRSSLGPGVESLIFGSEGTLGIVTEVVMRIHKLPKICSFDSIVFPTFQRGLDFMQDMSKTSGVPASLRLIDNFHYQLARPIRQSKGFLHDSIIDPMKLNFLKIFMGFDLNEMAVVSYKLEGDDMEIQNQQKVIEQCRKRNAGVKAGKYNGQMAYELTFLIGNNRDFLACHSVFGDSMETSVSWSNVRKVIAACQQMWKDEMEAKGGDYFLKTLACRISQVYTDGVCLYIYYAIGVNDRIKGIAHFQELKKLLIATFVRSGGSISHHHGIGRKAKMEYLQSLSPIEFNILQTVKKELDPKNIFANGNLYLNHNLQQKL